MWKDLIGGMKVGLIRKWIKHGLIPYTTSLKPDLIVSTIPAQALCQSTAHTFASYTIYANGSTEADGYPENSVTCDGTPDRDWYRVSNVFRHRTTEWSHKPARNTGAVPVVKPLWTDCNCHPWVLRAGRYGAWEKARLVHEVPAAVLAALEPEPEIIRGVERVTGETYEGGGKWRM
jgi:hypothetical protein